LLQFFKQDASRPSSVPFLPHCHSAESNVLRACWTEWRSLSRLRLCRKSWGRCDVNWIFAACILVHTICELYSRPLDSLRLSKQLHARKWRAASFCREIRAGSEKKLHARNRRARASSSRQLDSVPFWCTGQLANGMHLAAHA
jgi:hypothetical protein